VHEQRTDDVEFDVGEAVREKVGVARVRAVLVWRRVWAVGRVL